MLTGVAGLLGYYMRLNKYPVEPLILGLILGGKMEQAYRQALIISQGLELDLPREADLAGPAGLRRVCSCSCRSS